MQPQFLIWWRFIKGNLLNDLTKINLDKRKNYLDQKATNKLDIKLQWPRKYNAYDL